MFLILRSKWFTATTAENHTMISGPVGGKSMLPSYNVEEEEIPPPPQVPAPPVPNSPGVKGPDNLGNIDEGPAIGTTLRSL